MPDELTKKAFSSYMQLKADPKDHSLCGSSHRSIISTDTKQHSHEGIIEGKLEAVFFRYLFGEPTNNTTDSPEPPQPGPEDDCDNVDDKGGERQDSMLSTSFITIATSLRKPSKGDREGSRRSMIVEDESHPGKAKERAALTPMKFKKPPLPPHEKMRPPKPLERLLRRKGRHYFTAGGGVNEHNQRDVSKEATPFNVPNALEEFSYKDVSRAWRDKLRNDELSQLRYNTRHNHRSRLKKDLLRRLFVKEPEVDSMKTVLDIDPEFFTIVADRPIKEKLSIKRYVDNVRDVLRTRLITGYREDEILLIEENLAEEQRMIDHIKEQYQKCVASFESYMFEDYTNAMEILKECEMSGAVSVEMADELREVSKMLGTLKHQIYSLEDKWRNAKSYQKFLYRISPLAWRKQHDYLHKRSGSDTSLISEEEFRFEGRKLNENGEELSLDNLINIYKHEVAENDEPLIYFKQPEELITVFQNMELQNLNSLLHSEELSMMLEKIRIQVDTSKKQYDKTIHDLQEMIDSLAGGIQWEEERAIELEKLAKELINGEFKKLVSDEEYLCLHVYVEDAYETCIAPNDANLTAYDMMKTLELTHEQLLLRLDALPQAIVARAEADYRAEEGRVMEQALEARRKMAQIQRLRRRVQKSLAPPFVILFAPLKWRSEPPAIVSRPPPAPKPLTAEERHFLEFFTEFCKYKDDPHAFKSDKITEVGLEEEE